MCETLLHLQAINQNYIFKNNNKKRKHGIFRDPNVSIWDFIQETHEALLILLPPVEF